MDTVWLLNIIGAAGHDARSYSGRGMYGKRCVGVTIDGSLLGFLADLVEECEDTHDGAILMRAAQTDQMGRGTIVYWPRAEWLDEDDEEEVA